MAKPPVRTGAISPWREHFQELAGCPNVFCKISGLVTEADWKHWQPADFKPFIEVALAAFGVDRLMFGSDWPVCLLAAEYQQVENLAASALDPTAICKVFGTVAAAFYGISPGNPP
jgi:L-fuconolactonase